MGPFWGHLGRTLHSSRLFFLQLASRKSFRNCLLTVLSRIFEVILRIFSYLPLISRWSPTILAIFTRSRAILGLSWAFWSLPMSFRPHKNNGFYIVFEHVCLSAVWALSCPSRSHVRRLGTSFGPSWGPFGRSWAHLCPILGLCGASLGPS